MAVCAGLLFVTKGQRCRRLLQRLVALLWRRVLAVRGRLVVYLLALWIRGRVWVWHKWVQTREVLVLLCLVQAFRKVSSLVCRDSRRLVV